MFGICVHYFRIFKKNNSSLITFPGSPTHVLKILYGCLGLSLDLWYKPPVNIFLEKVTISGDSASSNHSWHQILNFYEVLDQF